MRLAWKPWLAEGLRRGCIVRAEADMAWGWLRLLCGPRLAGVGLTVDGAEASMRADCAWG